MFRFSTQLYCHLSSFSSGQAADPEQEGVGGHQEEPLAPILGEEGPGDGGSLPSGAANGGVGEEQCHYSFGGSGDHGPADRGVSGSGLHLLSTFWLFLLCAVMVMKRRRRRRSFLGEDEHFPVLFPGVLSAHPLVGAISGTGGRFSCCVIGSCCNEPHSNGIHVMFTEERNHSVPCVSLLVIDVQRSSLDPWFNSSLQHQSQREKRKISKGKWRCG